MLQPGLGPIVPKNASLLIGRCRNVDFSRTSDAPIFYRRVLRFTANRAAASVGRPPVTIVAFTQLSYFQRPPCASMTCARS